jgi:hypothetical protein
MAKGVAKNSDGNMIKTYDVTNEKVEFTTNVNEAYNFGILGTMEANNEIDFIKHHLTEQYKELETMEYDVVRESQ